MIYHGSKTVTTAGTAVPLSATRFPCATFTVQPLSDNTGPIRVGGRTISSPDSAPTSIPSGQGLSLETGDSGVGFPVGPPGMYDLSQIYIDADTNGDGVQFIAIR